MLIINYLVLILVTSVVIIYLYNGNRDFFLVNSGEFIVLQSIIMGTSTVPSALILVIELQL